MGEDARDNGLDHRLQRLQQELQAASGRFTIDAAIELTGRLQLLLASVEDYRLKIKWALGFVLAHTDLTVGSRREAMDTISRRLWTEHRIQAARSHLYECHKLYEVFDGDYNGFQEWIDHRRNAFNRPVYWIDVLNDCLGGRNNPAVIGEEAATQRDIYLAEDGVGALERLRERSLCGDGHDNGTIDGVLEAVRQTVDAPDPDSIRSSIPRSAEYLAFIRGFPCPICRKPAEAHHALGRSGTGMKGTDFGAVPLCRAHHRALHHYGRASFERRYAMSLAELAFNFIHKFVTGEWATMRIPEEC